MKLGYTAKNDCKLNLQRSKYRSKFAGIESKIYERGGVASNIVQSVATELTLMSEDTTTAASGVDLVAS
jgi:hypothetical protein